MLLLLQNTASKLQTCINSQLHRVLQTCTNALLHRAFKIRYFPNGDFLIAELGNWPSYMLGEALWQPKVVSNKGTGGSWAMETQ